MRMTRPYSLLSKISIPSFWIVSSFFISSVSNIIIPSFDNKFESIIFFIAFSEKSVLYGGSKKIISNFLFSFSNFSKASIKSLFIIVDLSILFVFSIFVFITLIASLELSQKVADFAPLLIASIPSAPLPANKSNTSLSTISNCIILNKASFTLSNVGLVFSPSSGL